MVAISATSRRSQSSLSLSQWPRSQGAIEGGMQRGNRGKLLHSLLEGTGERRDSCDDHGQRGIDIQGYETLAREVGRQFGTRPLGRRRESRWERGREGAGLRPLGTRSTVGWESRRLEDGGGRNTSHLIVVPWSVSPPLSVNVRPETTVSRLSLRVALTELQ